MSKSFLRFVLLTMIPSVIAQKEPKSIVAYVENGDPVEKGEYPYFAYLETRGCGGTLIAPDLVLTAAHCAKNFVGEDKKVYIGAYNRTNLDNGAEVRTCTHWTRHPGWKREDPNSFDYDWALCKLNENVWIDESENQLVLNNDFTEPVENDDLLIMGLGRTSFNADPDDTIITLDATIPAISNDECDDIWSSNFNSSLMLCAGEIGSTGTCKGDSGGPLIKRVGNIDYHVGLTSYGGGSDCVDNPSVYARTSTGYAWIVDTACNGEMQSIATFCSSTANPTATPTAATGSPTASTASPTAAETDAPTASISASPTAATGSPTTSTASPTVAETANPTATPTAATGSPTASTASPTVAETANPTATPTAATGSPTASTASPTVAETANPTATPTAATGSPTASTASPTADPTASPTVTPPEPETDAPTASLTDSPTGTPTGQPSLPPAPCPDDVVLFDTNGTTAIELDQAVRVIRQDTSTVTVRLYNAWTSSADVVQSIFYQYKSQHATKCYEEQNVVGGDPYEDVTIQCLVTKPYAELEIWIEDGNGVLDVAGDNAQIPKCCKPLDDLAIPAVKYTLVIQCETVCVEAVQRRGLRGFDE